MWSPQTPQSISSASNRTPEGFDIRNHGSSVTPPTEISVVTPDGQRISSKTDTGIEQVELSDIHVEPVSYSSRSSRSDSKDRDSFRVNSKDRRVTVSSAQYSSCEHSYNLADEDKNKTASSSRSSSKESSGKKTPDKATLWVPQVSLRSNRSSNKSPQVSGPPPMPVLKERKVSGIFSIKSTTIELLSHVRSGDLLRRLIKFFCLNWYAWAFLRILAILSPWATFILLYTGFCGEPVAICASGLSGAVVLCFGYCSNPPRRKMGGKIHKEHLINGLEILGEWSQDATGVHLKKFVDVATADQLEALRILADLASCWDVEFDRAAHNPSRSQTCSNASGHPSGRSGPSVSSRLTFHTRGSGSCRKRGSELFSEKASTDTRKTIHSQRMSQTASFAVSDVSVTSFTDFNRRQHGSASVQTLDLHLPLGQSVTSDVAHSLLLPGREGPIIGRDELASEVVASEAGKMTYLSTCDAVVNGTGKEAETFAAHVVGIDGGSDGMTRVRIEFKTQCLRTQNEWQQTLLNQQNSLLKSTTMQLKNTQEELQNVKKFTDDDDQKMLLRNFRKLVTRDFDDMKGMEEAMQRVAVVIIDEDKEVRDALQKLCQNLDYRCFAYENVPDGVAQVQRLLFPSTAYETGTFGRPSQELANWNTLPVILLGASLLISDRHPQLPDWKNNSSVFVALTSKADDFEDVGRYFVASGEGEVRERLRHRGISEYLFHPLSMNALRGIIEERLRTKLGDEYLLVDTLGRGRFGVVYRAKRLRDGEVFALKEVSLRRLKRTLTEQVVKVEPDMLKTMCWPTVVTLIDTWTSSKDLVQYLLLPVLAGGNVSAKIEGAASDREPISLESAHGWYAQTLHALSYLHWRGVLHRDIKPANLFLKDGLRLQVGDLGSAARLPGSGPHPNRSEHVTAGVTTAAYCGPEVFLSSEFYPASDLWALGVSFFEVFALKLPHQIPDTAHETGTLMDPSVLGSDAQSVLLTLRAQGNIIDEVAAELTELIYHVHRCRPTAAVLASRPHVRRELDKVLEFPDQKSQDEHSELFDRVLMESRLAAGSVQL